MYESPIKTIQKGVEEKFEEGVMKAICRMGIDVDREELIKALRYDRDQYNKGYQDGYEAGKWEWLKNKPLPYETRKEDCETEQPTGHWIDRQRVYSELTIGTCSKCGLRVAVGNYCPHCGEKMEEGKS